MDGIAADIGVKMDKTFIGTGTLYRIYSRTPCQDCTTHKNDNIHMINDTSFIVPFFHLG